MEYSQMAKRTRVSARRNGIRKTARQAQRSAHQAQPPQPAIKIASRRRRPIRVSVKYTSELLENARQRFEETDESLASIAVDLDIHKVTLWRLARRYGWKRHSSPPHDLSSAAKLLLQVKRLEDASLKSADQTAPAQRAAEGQVAGESALPPIEMTVEQMHRTVIAELATVQTMRAAHGREPQSPIDAERTARTLAIHTATLQKLQRMQCAAPQTGPYDDDIPADIDEFRNDLARRIDAFVESETDEEDGGSSNT